MGTHHHKIPSCFLILAVADQKCRPLNTCVWPLVITETLSTIMVISFQSGRSRQTVQTQIRLLLEEQSDQSLHCLQFHLHRFVEIPQDLASLFEF